MFLSHHYYSRRHRVVLLLLLLLLLLLMVVGTVSSEGLPPGWQEVHAEGQVYYWCVVSLSFDCLEKSSRFRLLLLCFLSSNRVIRCVYDNTNNELYWIIGGREEDPSSFSSFSSSSSSSSSSFRWYSSWKKDV